MVMVPHLLGEIFDEKKLIMGGLKLGLALASENTVIGSEFQLTGF